MLLRTVISNNMRTCVKFPMGSGGGCNTLGTYTDPNIWLGTRRCWCKCPSAGGLIYALPMPQVVLKDFPTISLPVCIPRCKCTFRCRYRCCRWWIRPLLLTLTNAMFNVQDCWNARFSSRTSATGDSPKHISSMEQ